MGKYMCMMGLQMLTRSIPLEVLLKDSLVLRGGGLRGWQRPLWILASLGLHLDLQMDPGSLYHVPLRDWSLNRGIRGNQKSKGRGLRGEA
jgi:hypothetical protein